MLTKFLSYIYIAKRKIGRSLQSCFIKTRLHKGSEMPIIKGNIYWNATNVMVGKNVILYPGVYLSGSNIEIGDNVQIGYGTVIFSKKKCENW